MNLNYLTTLDRAKQYLAINGTASDALLTRLISSASAFIQTWLNRKIANQMYVEVRDGQGMQQMLLQNYPVTSVVSLTINGLPIPPRTPLAPTITAFQTGGYVFDETRVMVDSYSFSRGFQNVAVIYTAGFVTSETQQIPEWLGPTLTTFQLCVGDLGVKYPNGTSFVKVTTTPSIGQYRFDDTVCTYEFADADADVIVTITYAYIPADIEQACIDMIGLKYFQRDRIGVSSKTIEGQTIAYTNNDMSPGTKTLLMNYKKLAPIS